MRRSCYVPVKVPRVFLIEVTRTLSGSRLNTQFECSLPSILRTCQSEIIFLCGIMQNITRNRYWFDGAWLQSDPERCSQFLPNNFVVTNTNKVLDIFHFSYRVSPSFASIRPSCCQPHTPEVHAIGEAKIKSHAP